MPTFIKMGNHTIALKTKAVTNGITKHADGFIRTTKR
jgi:hypothetical protein